MAHEFLPESTGEKYTQVVASCLTCMDLGDECGFEGDNSDLIGVRCIEKVGLMFRMNLECDC